MVLARLHVLSRCWPRSRKAQLLCLSGLVVLTAALLAGPSLWVEAQIFYGRRALEARRAEQALRHLRSAQRWDPRNAEVQFLLARAQRRLGRFDLVRKHIQRAWTLGYPVESLQREQWLALAQSGQLSEAEPHLAALLRDPRGDGPAICEAFVDGYFATYRFDQAFLLLDAWQKDYPYDPQPYVFRGLFLEHVGQWAKAVEPYRKALKLDPQRSDVRLRLARTLMQLQEYDEAAEHFARCLKEDPDDPDVLAGWGRCLVRQGKSAEARRAFQRALEIDPEHFDARLALGQLALADGRNQTALKRLTEACRERPHDTEARYALAKVLQAEGQTEAAKSHFQFVADARAALARAQSLMERIRTKPDDFEARYQIGITLLKYDDPAHGVAWLKSVLELRPDHRPTHEALADHFAENGLHKLAERHRRLAREQAPAPESRAEGKKPAVGRG